MESFSLQTHLDQIHSQYPPAVSRPVIGITTNYAEVDACVRDRYYKQVVDAGGTPILIPPIADENVIINTLDCIDGLILTGGGDINPLWSGEQPSPKLQNINAERDLPELLITRLAYNRQVPMLGICRGMQTLAVALDGKVTQDISDQPGVLKHSQDSDRSMDTHSVNIHDTDSMLFGIYQTPDIFVNSFHHQAIADTGSRFRVVATAPDGIVEAMESTEYKSILGVQWHPEWLGEDGRKLFEWLVCRAVEFRQAKDIHRRVLTLDTHCDTPMFFPQGIHFEQRDPRILVDLHKMTEGREDAVFMVAYLPQPKAGETFADKVPFLVETPFDYANLIFDKIEAIVRDNSRYLALARTADELYQNKRDGRKSIVLGIENALALNHDLGNVAHFAKRGVAYITLCHNGDNDICDSACGTDTHKGVSKFGAEVIREMNRLGVMVDLSHSCERSFYDALDISTQPIVCSHSSSRALCDHPRNLTDDQMRALATKGGVAHTTLYPGFLCKSGEATLLDAMRHLDHAIAVMGVEHVGLGTDFDGDGGVRGLADASELINFTIQLLRRRYNEADIERIWGGNWLRVMRQCQTSASLP